MTSQVGSDFCLSCVLLIVVVLAELDAMSSDAGYMTKRDVCACRPSLNTFVGLPAYHGAFIPGTVAMEERYMNLLLVMKEATARFSEASK